MPLVKAQCTNCNGFLEVDNSKDAAICPHCGTPYIVEKAIQHLNVSNTNYIQNAVFNGESEFDKLYEAAKGYVKLKDYRGAKKVSEEIAQKYPQRFEGWFGIIVAETSLMMEDDNLDTVASEYSSRAVENARKLSDSKQIEILNKWLNRYKEWAKEHNSKVAEAKKGVKVEWNSEEDFIQFLIDNSCFLAGAYQEPYEVTQRIIRLDHRDGSKYVGLILYVADEYGRHKYDFGSCKGYDPSSGIMTFKENNWGYGSDDEHYIQFLEKTIDGCYKVKHTIQYSHTEEYVSLRMFKEKSEIIEKIKKDINPQGCYIATCIYGSYDCPEVWVLRRFRDYSLAQSILGRAFIKAYYVISPTLVGWFGNTKPFRRTWKKVLDRMVARLKEKGVEDTQYYD